MDINTGNRRQFLRTFYILIGLAFIFVVAIFFLLSPKQNKQPALQLTGVSPELPIIISPWSTEPIIFTFNSPVNTETISYAIEPNVRSKIVSGTQLNQFSIVPLDGWDEDVDYTITIRKSLSSLRGEELQNDISVAFRSEPDFSQYPSEGGQESYDFEY